MTLLAYAVSSIVLTINLLALWISSGAMRVRSGVAINPFLVLGLLFVLAGGTARIAVPIFILFVLARVSHSIVYVRAIQPWRTITFALSALALVALMLATLFQFCGSQDLAKELLPSV